MRVTGDDMRDVRSAKKWFCIVRYRPTKAPKPSVYGAFLFSIVRYGVLQADVKRGYCWGYGGTPVGVS